MKTFKELIEKKEIPKGYHRMPDGSIMKDSDHPKKLRASYEDKEDEIDEISIAQTQQRRRNRKNASLRKAMAKYGAAAKAGIHPSRVHQRRNRLTIKKG